jgi:hypothetical protein
MKVLNTRPRNALFAGVLDVIAESLGGPRASEAPASANAATWAQGAKSEGEKTLPSLAEAAPKGWLARGGARLWRRQLRGVDAYIARSDAMFAALDRWLWKQRMRETEAWLAQSRDIVELEARIRQLERGPDSRIF